MARWTEEQERIMRENARKGAEAVRDMIAMHCGVSRSVAATQRHASRMGVLLEVHDVCPQCGALARLNRKNGVCPTCHMKNLLENSRHREERYREIRRNNCSKDTKAYKRAYDTQRQRNSREGRKSA